MLCPTCGDKRCLKANNYTLPCSKSMTHSITIPPELLSLWEGEAQEKSLIGSEYVKYVATKAGQYCADRELEACCEWIDTPAEFETVAWNGKESDQLRAARRPKPLSLKQQALETLERVSKDGYPCNYQDDKDWGIIRSALESILDPVL